MDVEDPNEKPDSYDVVSIEQERDKFLLCPPRVLGYSTQQKIWGQFKVDAVRRVEPVKIKTAFDTDLQLHQKYKDMIKALVENHTKTNDSKTNRKDMDVIEGKGRGLVILLHGPPGVGKTLTAETIAEMSAWLKLDSMPPRQKIISSACFTLLGHGRPFSWWMRQTFSSSLV